MTPTRAGMAAAAAAVAEVEAVAGLGLVGVMKMWQGMDLILMEGVTHGGRRGRGGIQARVEKLVVAGEAGEEVEVALGGAGVKRVQTSVGGARPLVVGHQLQVRQKKLYYP